MPNPLSSLFTRACSHQFAWPRRTSDGTLYQVCLICGDCFRYDWQTMSRGERITVIPQVATPFPTVWKPRSRRIHLEAPILYRQSDTAEWFPGLLQNISESGVSFAGDEPLCAGVEVEMIFVMPREITGQANSKVLCRGDMMRASRSKSGKYINAVLMSGYSFLPDSSSDQWSAGTFEGYCGIPILLSTAEDVVRKGCPTQPSSHFEASLPAV